MISDAAMESNDKQIDKHHRWRKRCPYSGNKKHSPPVFDCSEADFLLGLSVSGVNIIKAKYLFNIFE